MEDFASLKIYAVDAVVLVLTHIVPDRERLTRWAKHRIRTLIFFIGPVDGNLNTAENLEDLAEVRKYKDLPRNGRDSFRQLLARGLDKLEATPLRTVLVTDEARFIAMAGRNRMELLIGINSGHERRKFYQHGADLVLDSLNDLAVYGVDSEPGFSQRLPNIFSLQNKFQAIFRERKPVFFFDYDGTLTPIVSEPSEAVIQDDMRYLLEGLARFHSLAVVSGRDMEDLRNFIRLDDIIYAGSHGFRISGPGGLYMEQEQAKAMISGLDRIESMLRDKLENRIEGLEIERKRYAIAVHYRNSPPGSFRRIHALVTETIAENPDFKKARGKKILEIKPSTDWHKGRAIEWILQALGLDDTKQYCPIYLGDDITDEDAFRTLADDGIGILVGDHGQPTAASFQLKDVSQVKKFLHYALQSEI